MYEDYPASLAPIDRVKCTIAAAQLAIGMSVAPSAEPSPLPDYSIGQTATPDAWNYAAIDYAIANREEFQDTAFNHRPWSVLEGETDDSPNRRVGVETRSQLLHEELREVDLGMDFYYEVSDEEWQRAMARREEFKPLVFTRLQDLAKELYGVDIVFRDAPVVHNGPADAAPGKYPVRLPASMDDISFGTIYGIADFLGLTPVDFLNDLGVDTIRIFVAKPDSTGFSVIGTVDGAGAIEFATKADGEVGLHEAGHEVNRRFFGEWYAEDPVFDDLIKPPVEGERRHGISLSIESYEDLFDDAFDKARDTGGDEYYDISEQDGRCVVAGENPALANTLTILDDEPADSEEAKAHLYESLFTDTNLRLLDRCKPSIFSAARELLARLHTIAPRWAQWLAVQHTPSNYVPKQR